MSGFGGPWSSLLRFLRIPANARPGNPGWVIGDHTIVPAELIASYGGPPAGIAAARIGYTISTNIYWYEIMTGSNMVAMGWVLNADVRETSRYIHGGASDSFDFGRRQDEIVHLGFGPILGPNATPDVFAIRNESEVQFLSGSVLDMAADSAHTLIGGTAVPVETESSTNPTTTSTTYVQTANVVGVAFTAPPSGVVFVHVMGWIGSSSTTIGRRSYLTAEVRNGAVVGSGTVFDSAQDSQAAVHDCPSTAAGTKYSYGSVRYAVSNLTPGNIYNATTVIRSDNVADTSATFRRRVLVEPSLIAM